MKMPQELDAADSTLSLPTQQVNDPPPAENPLDDVFEADSAPPNANAETGAGRSFTSSDHSDIPRLRSIHITNGYRDGLSESKPRFVQQGFDEGYALGAVLGFRSSWLLRVLESILGRHHQDADSNVSLDEARRDLAVSSIFSRDYFDQDGVWTFPVQGRDDDDDDVDFERVSLAHPMIAKWQTRLPSLAGAAGLELAPFATRHADDG